MSRDFRDRVQPSQTRFLMDPLSKTNGSPKHLPKVQGSKSCKHHRFELLEINGLPVDFLGGENEKYIKRKMDPGMDV